jgi:putative membrane protein
MKANQELTGIATKLNITPASEISKHCREMKEKLAKTSGGDFDREFIAAQVKGHEEALQMYKDQAKNGANADLKAFAAKTIPTIEEHLRQAQELSKSLPK